MSYYEQEKWESWEPAAGISGRYYIKKIVEDWEIGLQIFMISDDDKDKKICITFEKSPWIYKVSAGVTNYKRVDFLEQTYGKSFYALSTFFKVTDSFYLIFFGEETYGLWEDIKFTHFVFWCTDTIIDVINKKEPTVTFLQD